MPYTLLIGNNFIRNSPKIIKKDVNKLFEVNEDKSGPYINAVIQDIHSKTRVKIEKNVCTFNSDDMKLKKNDRMHVLILDKNGEIVFESRIVDKKTIIVSGIFANNSEQLIITQNYIILPSKKWIMHSKVDANNSDITISEKGIAADIKT